MSQQDEYKFIKIKGEKWGYRALAKSIVIDKEAGTVAFTRVHKGGELEAYDLVPLEQIERISSGAPVNSKEPENE